MGRGLIFFHAAALFKVSILTRAQQLNNKNKPNKYVNIDSSLDKGIIYSDQSKILKVTFFIIYIQTPFRFDRPFASFKPTHVAPTSEKTNLISRCFSKIHFLKINILKISFKRNFLFKRIKQHHTTVELMK